MKSILGWLTEHGKPLQMKVTTMDADLNAVSIDRDAPGQQLFDTVCKIIGLREVWYFGLCYTNRKGYICWLQMDKKIRLQGVPKQPDGTLHFLFLVKFFPESVKAELIQDLTRHLFFLQTRQSILSMDIYCPSEAAILLASYAVQAIYGDHQEGMELDLAKLIPLSVVQQYDMSPEMWDEKIRNWWANNSGMSREDAEEEFLSVAEELDMYGTQYYPIRNQKELELLLGVSAQGLGIYEPDNKLSPRPFFSWTEIKCISFKNKMFTICTADKSKIRFRAEDMSINQSLLDLCVGTHNLYLRRRQPDLLEVQQMRIQAQEQRQRRLAEQTRLQKEREQRMQAELERDRLRAEMGHLNERLDTMQLAVERARLSEQEAMDLARRANEAEAEMQRIKFSQLRAEENKLALERKVRDAESLAQRLIRQQNGAALSQPPPYPEFKQNRNPIIQNWDMGFPLAMEGEEQQNPKVTPHHNGNISPPGAGKTAKTEKTSGPTESKLISKSQRVQAKEGCEDMGVDETGQRRQSFATELQNIYAEMEQSRSEYNERNHSLREKLLCFRTELEALRREGSETDNDRIFGQKLITGCFNKYDTLRKSGAGSSKARAIIFEEMVGQGYSMQNSRQ